MWQGDWRSVAIWKKQIGGYKQDGISSEQRISYQHNPHYCGGPGQSWSLSGLACAGCSLLGWGNRGKAPSSKHWSLDVHSPATGPSPLGASPPQARTTEAITMLQHNPSSSSSFTFFLSSSESPPSSIQHPAALLLLPRVCLLLPRLLRAARDTHTHPYSLSAHSGLPPLCVSPPPTDDRTETP